MNEDFLTSLTSRGYWRVNIRPTAMPAQSLTLSACLEVVERSAVSLRGWDYPHIPRRAGDDNGIERLDDCVQAWTDWQNHREFWRMYASTQFLHYLGLYEDWRERDASPGRPPSSWGSPIEGPVFGVLGSGWTVVEVFEFAARLGREGLYAEGASVSLELRNTKDRQLYVEDPGRAPFAFPRVSGAETINFTKTMSPAELANPKEIAGECIAHIFDRFGWNPGPGQVVDLIDQLYERRF